MIKVVLKLTWNFEDNIINIWTTDILNFKSEFDKLFPYFEVKAESLTRHNTHIVAILTRPYAIFCYNGIWITHS